MICTCPLERENDCPSLVPTCLRNRLFYQKQTMRGMSESLPIWGGCGENEVKIYRKLTNFICEDELKGLKYKHYSWSVLTF